MKENNLLLRQQVLDLIAKGWKSKKILLKLNISYTKFNYLKVSDDKLIERKKYRHEYTNKRKLQKYYCLKQKVDCFQKRSICDIPFTYLDVINKFGENPKCYLTGKDINYDDPNTYQLDHILSVNKGGKSNLDNLQLAYPKANEMKRHYDLQEFIQLCKDISEHNKDK